MTTRQPAGIDLQPLLALLRRDDLDAAIDAGLMACDPDGADDAHDRALLAAAQRKLRTAWTARERYRARNARLARRAAERKARRTAMPDTRATAPALPPAAAAALAKAKAKAARKP